jgi:metallo-beta-lactamase family protein
MLADTARIQEENASVDAVVAGPNRPLDRAHVTREDVARTVQHCVAVEYDQPHPLGDTIEFRFIDAGHILGSAMVHVGVSDAAGDYRLTFSGDLGRRGLPFLRDTDAVPPCDLLICESTYGGRRHDSRDEMVAKLAAVMHRTAERGGKVLIPAFSLGRTQLVLFYLRRWMALGRLPRLPIYADSPLAMTIGQVYDQHPAAFQVAASPDDPSVHFVASFDESQELTQQKGSCVIVASGGMCEGGRIVGHLKQHLDDPRTSVVLVSYQAPGSLGARLLERKPTVRFHGRNWNKWAEVVELNGFSGHADHDDLTDYLDPLVGTARQVRLVHGELHAAQALADSLLNHGFDDVGIPAQGQTVVVAG